MTKRKAKIHFLREGRPVCEQGRFPQASPPQYGSKDFGVVTCVSCKRVEKEPRTLARYLEGIQQ